MAKRFVYGNYPTLGDAEVAVDRLVEQGVPQSAITIVGNDSVVGSITSNAHVVTSDEYYEHTEENNGFWDNLFGFFTDDNDVNRSDINLDEYRNSLNNDEVLVLLDSDYEGRVTSFADTSVAGVTDTTAVEYDTDTVDYDTNLDTETTYDRDVDADLNLTDEDRVATDYTDVDRDYTDVDPNLTDDVDHDHQTVRLHEEKLNVEARETEAGTVRLDKRVVEESETVDVPVRHEEVHVTHHDVTDQHAVDSDHAFREETIEVPLSNEEVSVQRETVVTGEVDIDKTSDVEHQQVTETKRKEVLEVEEDGNIVTEENDLNR